jgi:hypothetical protein
MPDRDSVQPPKKAYPPLYERILPVAMVLIGLAILVVLLIIFLVALGLIPGS